MWHLEKGLPSLLWGLSRVAAVSLLPPILYTLWSRPLPLSHPLLSLPLSLSLTASLSLSLSLSFSLAQSLLSSFKCFSLYSLRSPTLYLSRALYHPCLLPLALFLSSRSISLIISSPVSQAFSLSIVFLTSSPSFRASFFGYLMSLSPSSRLSLLVLSLCELSISCHSLAHV